MTPSGGVGRRADPVRSPHVRRTFSHNALTSFSVRVPPARRRSICSSISIVGRAISSGRLGLQLWARNNNTQRLGLVIFREMSREAAGGKIITPRDPHTEHSSGRCNSCAHFRFLLRHRTCTSKDEHPPGSLRRGRYHGRSGVHGLGQGISSRYRP